MVKKKLYIIIALAAAVLIAVFLFVNFQQEEGKIEDTKNQDSQNKDNSDATPQTDEPKFEPQNFDNIKTPHYVSSSPENNSKVKIGTIDVEINFNFDLASGSTITVTKGDKAVSTGPTTISEDKLRMSLPIDASSEGNYKVEYKACWPDGSCHDGSFGFAAIKE